MSETDDRVASSRAEGEALPGLRLGKVRVTYQLFEQLLLSDGAYRIRSIQPADGLVGVADVIVESDILPEIIDENVEVKDLPICEVEARVTMAKLKVVG